MGGVLTQLFEITALFDMRLRPELVLLQKTMVVTEGVARRLYPDHDIWKAADPVVRRYILRELSPPARLLRLVEQGGKVLEALARRIETPAPASVEPPETRHDHWLWFALGVAAAGLAFALAAMLR